MIKLNKERVSEIDTERKNAEARKYLAETDWYVTRFAETGVAIPAVIVEARQQARESVS